MPFRKSLEREVQGKRKLRKWFKDRKTKKRTNTE